jgi:hypothetical protein
MGAANWSYGSWIYSNLCNPCLSPLTLWFRTPFMARCTQYNIIIESLLHIATYMSNLVPSGLEPHGTFIWIKLKFHITMLLQLKYNFHSWFLKDLFIFIFPIVVYLKDRTTMSMKPYISSSIRTKFWWNSHWMVRQSRSPTKMATTVQLCCYWKRLQAPGSLWLFNFKKFSCAAIFVRGWDHQTQFWKRTIQWLFYQSLVPIEQLVPEEAQLNLV